MRYIPVQLEAISRNLRHRKINFWLFHDNAEEKKILPLAQMCETMPNVNFFAVAAGNAAYDELAKFGGAWSGAAYFPLMAHKYLPVDAERVLYIDAGDTLIVGDIDEYYGADFEGNALIVTAGRYKKENGALCRYNSEDIFDPALFAGILRGLFNSGSYVINLSAMRKMNFSFNEYIYCANSLHNTVKLNNITFEGNFSGEGEREKSYFGDQGFLSAIFVGNLKIFGYEQVRNIFFMPYNFCLWFFDTFEQQVPYEPRIIHYAGVPLKPWSAKYPLFLPRFQNRETLRDLKELRFGQTEYFYLWHEYAMLADRRMGLVEA